MADILITVSGQSMVFTSMPVIASHGVNEDYVEFTFDSEWTGFAKVATFYHERTPERIVNAVVNGSNRALIPHEVTEKPGRIFIGVTGVQGGINLTSETLPYPILPGSNYKDGENADDPTPSMLDQILSAMAEMVGAPLTANTAADMVDTSRIYVYTGSEVGYVNGSWYYYDGDSWVVGGVYNSQAISDSFRDEIADMVKQSAVASESDSVPYLYRPTPNPSAILADEEIVGGTIAHNQLWTLDNLPSDSALKNSNTYTANGVTFTKNTDDNSITIQTAGAATATTSIKIGSQYTLPFVANHNTLFRGCPGGSETTYNINWLTSRNVFGEGQVYAPSADGFNLWLRVMSGATISTPIKIYPQVTDLDAAFGSTIASYVAGLGNPSGVAKLREWGFLSKPYFAYDAGSLVSVNTSGKRVTGKNLLKLNDGEYTIGNTTVKATVRDGVIYLSGTAAYAGGRTTKLTDNFWLDAGTYYIAQDSAPQGSDGYINDSATNVPINATPNRTVTLEKRTQVYFGINLTAGRNYTGTIVCPQLEIGSIRTSWRPYRSTTYPTTPTDLNGIFKLDANNNLYADGDIYKADGTITRRYGFVDLGSLTWEYTGSGDNVYFANTSYPSNVKIEHDIATYFCSKYTAVAPTTTANLQDKQICRTVNNQARFFVKDSSYSDAATFTTAMSGVYLCYELATPTTDTADTYPATQIAPKGGTEEWVDNRAVPVPVGHRTQYYIGVPDVPANANNATLHATVSGGKTTLTWS